MARTSSEEEDEDKTTRKKVYKKAHSLHMLFLYLKPVKMDIPLL